MWPVGQAVKTAASHAANVGSIPARVTKPLKSEKNKLLNGAPFNIYASSDARVGVYY